MWKPGKIVTILLWVISIISVAVCVYAFIRCGALNVQNPGDREIMMGVINPMFIWIYVLLVLTALVAVLMPIPQLLKNPKGLMGMIFGLVGFGAVILIAYLLSSAEPLPFPPGHIEVSEGTLRLADLNLISSYIMFILTIVTVLFSSIFVKMIRK